jgi:hypothetical protein
MTMTERTVSVELTEAELNSVYSMLHGLSFGFGDVHRSAIEKLVLAQTQFTTDREREEKLQVLREIVLPPASGIFSSKRLDDLNKAGGELVRMEDKKPYSEWEVRDMMNSAYRSEDK